MVKTKPPETENLLTEPAAKGRERDDALNPAILSNDFFSYQLAILHDWLRTITILAFTLVPLFFVLDLFLIPPHLLVRFAVYRLISTAISLSQFFVVRKSKPGTWSYLYAYLTSLQIGCMITLMTVSLGGFDSSYYAGLNLVIVGVNLLLPWSALHTAANAVIVIIVYVAFNVIAGQPFHLPIMANNLFFLIAMSVVAASINHVRYRLIHKEFSLLVQLQSARDALWGEMEVAKRIQTALLPKSIRMAGYEIAAVMIPADEVGGDYYDVVETAGGDRWVAVGDVSGHGVDSGLIMMMAQTSIMTIIKEHESPTPAEVIISANHVIRENISRLDSSHYMTLMLLKLGDDSICYAGRHQDVLISRRSDRAVDIVPATGTWLGITEDLAPFLEEREVPISENDTILLFTDGVTELQDVDGNLFGQERLADAFEHTAHLPLNRALESLLEEVRSFPADQHDDITLVLLRRVP
jgi:phosphoserine phosphatase RsbU/P